MRWNCGVLAVAAVVFAGAVPAKAAEPVRSVAPVGAAEVMPKPVLGVLDLQQVLTASSAAKMVIAQREKYMNTYQAQVSEQEKSLRDADRELDQQRVSLSQEELSRRRAEFQQRVGRFQKEVETRRRNLERAYTLAMNEIQVAVIRHTQDLAKRRGMNMVVYRSQVFLFDPVMDITNDVLAAVNASLPSVTMPDPASLPPAKEGR